MRSAPARRRGVRAPRRRPAVEQLARSGDEFDPAELARVLHDAGEGVRGPLQPLDGGGASEREPGVVQEGLGGGQFVRCGRGAALDQVQPAAPDRVAEVGLGGEGADQPLGRARAGLRAGPGGGERAAGRQQRGDQGGRIGARGLQLLGRRLPARAGLDGEGAVLGDRGLFDALARAERGDQRVRAAHHPLDPFGRGQLTAAVDHVGAGDPEDGQCHHGQDEGAASLGPQRVAPGEPQCDLPRSEPHRTTSSRELGRWTAARQPPERRPTLSEATAPSRR